MLPESLTQEVINKLNALQSARESDKVYLMEQIAIELNKQRR